jgi:hypothetical protein
MEEGGKTTQSIGLKSLKERDYMKDLKADEKIISKWISKKLFSRMSTRFIWLRIGTSDGIL